MDRPVDPAAVIFISQRRMRIPIEGLRGEFGGRRGFTSAREHLASIFRAISRRVWDDAIPPETAALRLEKILRPSKIFVAGQGEKSYYRFCRYGNYENTRLCLYQVFRLPSGLGLDRFRIGHCPAKSP